MQRGGKDLLKSIQMKAKQVSESSGMSERMSLTSTPKVSPMPDTGAYASIKKMNSTSVTPIQESGYEKKLKDRLLESVETLGVTKEYFNATSSLFTLYTMGALTESVMDSLSMEDIREIKGIIREFKSVIDSY